MISVGFKKAESLKLESLKLGHQETAQIGNEIWQRVNDD